MSDKILGISGIENFYPFIDMKSVEIREVQYPDVDMQNLPFNENTFDFVISDQVIEHLLNPKKAIHEFYRVVKKRGRLREESRIHVRCARAWKNSQNLRE